MSKSKTQNPKFSVGFTLVELLVVIAVIAIISAVVIFNHRDFSSRIDMANLAYEVALEVREAQVFGISVVGQAANFERGYGVHINLDEDNGGDKTVIIFFTDPTDGNGLYGGNDVHQCEDDCVRRFLIGRGNEIEAICEISGESIEGDCDINILDIVYYRPDAEANIRFDGRPDVADGAIICLASPQDVRSRVIVRDSGQISVDTFIENCNDDLSS